MRVKTLGKCVFALLTALCVAALGAVGYYQYTLPDSYTVSEGSRLTVGRWVAARPTGEPQPAALSGEALGSPVTLSLLGVVPVKSVTVHTAEMSSVTVCGIPFGIKLYMDGVLVVGMSDVATAAGAANPAAAAGIRVGDTIVSINGQAVTTNEEVAKLVNRSGGRPLTLRVRRDGVEFTASFTPVRPADGSGWRAGLWVRDSTAGIGMLTFYDPATGAYGGLGHPVCDADTGSPVSVSGGEIVPARIYRVQKSVKGSPGELNGGFEPGRLGSLQGNADCGLFGGLSLYPAGGRTMPVAMKQEVHTGAAQILTTVEGKEPALYTIEIRQVRTSAAAGVRNMVIRITDPVLLEKTGGVVQGMSGSPILQDGKLAGAVTHVLVDDPESGYGVFAETMLARARQVKSETTLQKAG